MPAWQNARMFQRPAPGFDESTGQYDPSSSAIPYGLDESGQPITTRPPFSNSSTFGSPGIAGQNPRMLGTHSNPSAQGGGRPFTQSPYQNEGPRAGWLGDVTGVNHAQPGLLNQYPTHHMEPSQFNFGDFSDSPGDPTSAHITYNGDNTASILPGLAYRGQGMGRRR